jgi:hypothetical protein
MRTLNSLKLYSANVFPPGKSHLGWFNLEEQMLVLVLPPFPLPGMFGLAFEGYYRRRCCR